MKKRTPREIVLEVYPTAEAFNVGTSPNKFYHIVTENNFLGKGKSKKAAWKAAMRHGI